MPKKLTTADLLNLKASGTRFSAISCYDFTTAALVAQAGTEMILVGDSAAQIMLGHSSTLPATMDFMVTITAAVRRGAPDVCLVADMPFLSYQVSKEEAIRNAGRFIVEASADIIKVESSAAQLDTIKALSDAGIPVMAHIGLRPQSIVKTGKLKAEGTVATDAYELILLADRMVLAGASTLLLEGTASRVAAIITDRVNVPVIGCGSGPHCDGQILLISDIIGTSQGHLPKFSKKYAELDTAIINAVKAYIKNVQSLSFPDDEHSYHINSAEIEKLKDMLEPRQ
ncbi:MAG: 3-methyl-2-oxobutanoate hydroxymethyltransferase [Planctomycetes bacterium]|nr:3-methyl-2-oxobutanoate hydroxymethyltransferase [Planctomycetota bacterium]